MNAATRVASVLVLSGAALGCGEGDAHFSVNYAQGFPKSATTVSVFGIFKDGRVSAESWDELGEGLSVPLSRALDKPAGGKSCETFYSTELLAKNAALASTVDDATRANGITEPLLDRFGPVARGETILVITIAGRVPPRTGANAGAPTQSVSGGLPTMGRGGGVGRHQPTSSFSETAKVKERSVFEMSALLFSVPLHQSVAVVNMSYSGVSVEEALKKFTEKLGVAIPGARCAGWDMNVQVDEESLKHLVEP